MAKGKRTYVAYYSTETGNMVHTTNINKRSFETSGTGKKGPELRKYNPKTRKHEVLKMKEIKRG